MSIRDSRLAACWLVLLVFVVATGCGGEDLGKPAKVTGKVTVDGQPLSGAVVTFHCISGLPPEQRTQQATTGGDGAYELPTVYPGKYEVSVTPAPPPEISDPGRQPAIPPTEYKPASGDQLTTEVNADMNFDIQLTKK